MFENRKQAGERLAKELLKYKDENPIVVGLPRGGIVVAKPVARALGVPLETLVVRKIGAPGNREYAIGAIVEGGYSLFNEDAIERLGISDYEIQEVLEGEQKELKRRAKLYRAGKASPQFAERAVILVDDGLATGLTAEVVVGAILDRGAKKVIFAAPVCAQDSIENLSGKVEVVCLEAPEGLVAIGNHYQDFSQVTDEEVVELLNKHVKT
ncbi:MAG: phosphoribosyltransferase family protein [Patescibacteria group bacterium]